MKGSVRPLESGSRSLSIDTAYLMLDATVHPDGTVEVHDVDIRDPRSAGLGDTVAKVTDDMIRIAEINAAVCESCPELRGVSRVVKGRDVYRVRCNACGCGGLSLANGRCPQDKWPIRSQ